MGFNVIKESVEDLRSQKFSLIIDETTDRTCKNQLPILVTYFNPDKYQVEKDLIDIVQLDDGKAETINQAILKCFNDKNIPVTNIIGFCADTCNVMFGRYHSVSQLHHFLFITRKPVSICIKQRRPMHAHRFYIVLHETCIQYRNLNIHEQTLASKCVNNKEISRQYHEWQLHRSLERSLQSQHHNHSNKYEPIKILMYQWANNYMNVQLLQWV